MGWDGFGRVASQTTARSNDHRDGGMTLADATSQSEGPMIVMPTIGRSPLSAVVWEATLPRVAIVPKVWSENAAPPCTPRLNCLKQD